MHKDSFTSNHSSKVAITTAAIRLMWALWSPSQRKGSAAYAAFVFCLSLRPAPQASPMLTKGDNLDLYGGGNTTASKQSARGVMCLKMT